MHVPDKALFPTVASAGLSTMALRAFVLGVLTVGALPAVTVGGPWWLLVGWAAAWLWGVVSFVRSVRRGAPLAWRKLRVVTGWLTGDQRNELARVTNLDRSEDQARALASGLVKGEPCNLGRPWDLPLEPDETVHFDGLSGYARFHPMDVGYVASDGVAYRSPLFVEAGMVGAANASAPVLRLAAEHWREHQWVRFVVTSLRVAVRRNDTVWLNFWYEVVQGVYPKPEVGLLFLEFDGAAALRIEGPAAALAAVAIVWRRHGVEGLNDHPGLDYLHSSGVKFLQ